MQPGGEANNRRVFKCNAHVKCPVSVRLVRKTNLEVVLEKVHGLRHTSRVQVYDRANALLTMPQKAEVQAALSYGATADRVVQKLSRAALDGGAEFKATAGDELPGVQGAC